MTIHDPRIPTADACVVGALLRHQAQQQPDKVFAIFEDGSRCTIAETLHNVAQTATRRDLGMQQGDHVLFWLPNGRKALFRFLEPRMAHCMLPRHIRIIDDLPKAPTQKIQKVRLREDGIPSDTWDREAAGIKIRREKIGTQVVRPRLSGFHLAVGTVFAG